MDTQEFKEILTGRVLILDGAMGTMIQRLRLSESDFRGSRFSAHEEQLKGCNDVLCLTQPDIIKSIHIDYIESGADIIATNSFNANAVSMSDYGLDRYPGIIYEINRNAAMIAKEAASSADREIFVAGSIGPTNRSASMSPDIENPALRNITYDDLFEAYSEQTEGLIEGGVDILLFETVFDTLNLKAGLDAANKVMTRLGINLPIMVSATLSDKSGRTLSGQTLAAFVTSIEDYDNVVSIGLNCSCGGKEMLPHIAELGKLTSHFVSAHPNAGLPNALGNYDETPDKFALHMGRALKEGLVNIAGGCCGTTPDHIRKLAALKNDAVPHKCAHQIKGLRVSGLNQLEVLPGHLFVNVGERCNVAGSRKFLRLIREGKYDEALQVARKQVEDGAMMIDVNMDDPLLNAKEEMVTFLRYVASDPEIAKVPVMVDSSNWDVIESALKNLQGKSIVNSISLKESEEQFIKKGRRIRELGSAVIVMAFDENGQADTFKRKTEICERAYKILTQKCGFKPEDIIFDVNVMAIATGMEEHAAYALDFIKAVEWVRQNLPGALTSGGISNLSFAFRGKNNLRESMHAVFLYHAISAGLDMGIVNPASSVTYDDIDPDLRLLLEDAILCRHSEASENLVKFVSENIVDSPTPTKEDAQADIEHIRRLTPVEERLSTAIIKGDGTHLIDDLTDGLESGMSPVKLIEGPLMKGMKHVGDLFGVGKMFLPQVVKTARTMKQAIDILQPHMLKSSASATQASSGKILFATVKGDVHDIGKNITSIVLACNNFEVIDLGVMVPAEKIVETAIAETPDILCLSGLITPSLAEMTNVAAAMKDAGLSIPIIVGGATTSPLHTALKIAPVYDGIVVNATDASQNPTIATRLLDKKTREVYRKSIYDEYERLKNTFNSKSIEIIPIKNVSEATQCRMQSYSSPQPRIPIDKPIIIKLDLGEISHFINWKMFFHAWNLNGSFISSFPYEDSDKNVATWMESIPASEKIKAGEALDLYRSARSMLHEITAKNNFDGKAAVVFCHASSNGSDIMIGNEMLPMLRQQAKGSQYLSLADFVGYEDYIGIFAVTSGNALAKKGLVAKNRGDEYLSLLLQTLSDRIAEGASEWLHLKVRRELWGYASDENDDIHRIMRGEYNGIRPAVGYPSIPDQTIMHILSDFLPMDEIGISITENGAMSPSSSVCGLYLANPEARYFMVGKIGEDQLEDYSRRRKMDVIRMKKILRM